MNKRFIFLISLCLATACSGPVQQPDNTSPEEAIATQPAQEPVIQTVVVPDEGQTPTGPDESSTKSDPIPRELVEIAINDLSEHTGVNQELISLVDATSMNWPDTSLGCPQPDMAYATVMTPGYWLLLEANGEKYPYHTDDKEQVILCLTDPSDPDAPRPIIPIKPGEIKDGEPWVPVN